MLLEESLEFIAWEPIPGPVYVLLEVQDGYPRFILNSRGMISSFNGLKLCNYFTQIKKFKTGCKNPCIDPGFKITVNQIYRLFPLNTRGLEF